MGKTFRKDSDDFYSRKSNYENRNCNKKSAYYADSDTLEEVKRIIERNNKKEIYELHNDKKRR